MIRDIMDCRGVTRGIDNDAKGGKKARESGEEYMECQEKSWKVLA